MANNRMLLICNVCVPVGAEWPRFDSPALLHIAKWYPAGSWHGEPPGDGAYYSNAFGSDEGKIEYVNRLEGFLQRHQHLEIASEHYMVGAGQENPVRLEYESEGLPAPTPPDKSSEGEQ